MSSEYVIKLRKQTGAGIMDCKKALEEASFDFEKALLIVKKQGLAKADKKENRDASAGYLESYIHQGRVGVLLHINAETDFVTRSDDFKDMARNLSMHIVAMAPESIDELMDQDYVKDPSMKVKDFIKGVIGKLGEKIELIQFTRYSL